MTTKKKVTKSKSTAKKSISENDIRSKAQKIYEDRIKNGTSGDAHSDWAQAEKVLGIK